MLNFVFFIIMMVLDFWDVRIVNGLYWRESRFFILVEV